MLGLKLPIPQRIQEAAGIRAGRFIEMVEEGASAVELVAGLSF
jgi:hypothetical protein